jgi:hypothetical protein
MEQFSPAMGEDEVNRKTMNRAIGYMRVILPPVLFNVIAAHPVNQAI